MGKIKLISEEFYVVTNLIVFVSSRYIILCEVGFTLKLYISSKNRDHNMYKKKTKLLGKDKATNMRVHFYENVYC